MEQPTLASRVAGFLLKHPAFCAVIVLGTLAFGAIVLPSLEIASGMDVFYRDDSPEQRVQDEVTNAFVGDDLLFIAYAAPDVFSAESLDLARELGHALEEIKIDGAPGEDPLFLVDEVISLATVDTLVGSQEFFRAQELVPHDIPREAEALDAIRKLAHRNPVLSSELIAEDDKAAVIVVRLTKGLSDPNKNYVVAAIRELLSAARNEHPSTELHLAGDAVIEVDSAREQREGLQTLLPLSYIIVTVLLYGFLRSLFGLVIALFTASLGAMTGAAMLVAIGSNINACTLTLPPLLLVLTVAMAIHFLSEYGKTARELDHARAAHETLASLLPPTFVAAATTAVGFGALMVSDIPAVFDFGLAASIGMMICFVVLVTLMALVWSRFPASSVISERGAALSDGLSNMLDGFHHWLLRARWPILVGGVLVSGFFIAGIPRIDANNVQIDFFRKDAAVHRADTFMKAHLTGTSSIVVAIRTEDREHWLDPKELAKLEGLSAFLEKEAAADVVTSIADYLKLMHREFYNGDPARHTLPSSASQAAQLLVLNDDTQIEEYIDGTYRWVRIAARSRYNGSTQLSEAYHKIDAYLAEHFPAASGYTAHATGQSRLWSTVADGLIRSQKSSLTLSVLIVSLILLLLFRSFKTAVYSVPPNVFPILAILGTMGWTGIRLDPATVMTATVALGIAVDDTVHFLQRYRAELRLGKPIASVLQDTLHMKGAGMLGTSVIISLVFFSAMTSSFVPTVNFGLLGGLAIIAAFIGDVLFLPPLLLIARTRLGVPLPEAAPAAATSSAIGAPEPLAVHEGKPDQR